MFLKKGIAYTYPMLKVCKMLQVNQTRNKMLENKYWRKIKRGVIGNVV